MRMANHLIRRIQVACVVVSCSICASCSFESISNKANANTDCDTPSVAMGERKSIKMITAAAARLASSLSEDLSQRARYCLGDAEQHAWTNVPGRRSGGVRLGDMDVDQQKLVWGLLDVFMSDAGYEKAHLIATDIEVASGAGPTDDYTVALFGDPANDGAWGFQFDGHHLALNFVVHADHVVLAPIFLGTQPLGVDDRYPLEYETSLGQVLISTLSPDERTSSQGVDLIGRDVRAGSGRGHDDRGRLYDVKDFDGVGVKVSELSQTSRVAVEGLVGTYLGNLTEPFSDEVLDEVLASMDGGFFTYETRGQRTYYRVYVPDVLLIEYNDVSHDHIHTITRLLGSDRLSDYGLWASNASPRTIAEHVLLADHHQHPVHDWH